MSVNKAIGHYYEVAKRADWQLEDLPWETLPPVPEYSGPLQKVERRRDFWRSVVMQQLQADRHAVNMSAQLLYAAPDLDAKLYYTIMVQDEARHTEAWQRLIGGLGGDGEHNPHLDELVRIVLEANTLEEKIFLMQVFFEKIIIPKFKMIRDGAPGTVLEELCKKLIIDDTIHHRSGVAYERQLLETAPTRTKKKVVGTATQALPTFAKYALWKPAGRLAIARLTEGKDRAQIISDVEDGMKIGQALGLDFSEVPLPRFS